MIQMIAKFFINHILYWNLRKGMKGGRLSLQVTFIVLDSLLTTTLNSTVSYSIRIP